MTFRFDLGEQSEKARASGIRSAWSLSMRSNTGGLGPKKRFLIFWSAGLHQRILNTLFQRA